MAHLRRLTLLLSVALPVLLCAWWVRTGFKHDTLSWLRTSVTRNPALAEGTLGAWETTIVTRSIGPNHGSLAYIRSEYLSLSEHDPDEAAVRRTHGAGTLNLRTVDASKVRPDERVPRRFFRTPTDWRIAGFGVYQSAGGAMTHATIEAPIWFIALAASCPSVVWLRRTLRRRGRRARGLCPACGYDLSGRAGFCPECGPSAWP